MKNIARATRNKEPDGKFGDDLICVRYRYDETHMMAIKTVELVVEKTPWKKRPEKIRRDRTIYIHIDYGEIELGRKVREAGGFWNREKSMGNSASFINPGKWLTLSKSGSGSGSRFQSVN